MTANLYIDTSKRHCPVVIWIVARGGGWVLVCDITTLEQYEVPAELLEAYIQENES